MDSAIQSQLTSTLMLAKSGAGQAKIAQAGAALKTPGVEKLSAEELARIRDTSTDFEAVFLTEMLRPMFETLEVDPVFGGGKGEEIFRGMIVDEYGKLMAKKGGIGLAEHVMAHMITLQTAQLQEVSADVNTGNADHPDQDQDITVTGE